MPDFITLLCPSCGAKLNITEDIDCYTCSHCGQEHIVKRSGGIVTLSPVVDAINRVGTGVDKTAAGLVIVQLKKEIEELKAIQDKFAALNPRPSVRRFNVIMVVLGVIVLLSSVAVYLMGINGVCLLCVGAVLLIIGLVPILLLPRNKRFWDSTSGETLKALTKKIGHKSDDLERAREMVK